MIKICNSCGKEIDLSSRKRKCKHCISAYNRKYYAAHQEAEKLRSKKWREENIDRVKNRERNKRIAKGDFLNRKKRERWALKKAEYCRVQRERYAASGEKQRAASLVWKNKNKEKCRMRRSFLLKKFPEKNREQALRRYAMKLAAVPSWADKKKIVSIYRLAVLVSEETGIPHEIDHFFPLKSKYMSGLHCEENLRVVTQAENRRKKNSIPICPETWSYATHTVGI